MIYQSYFSHDSHVSIICITWPSFLHHFSIHGPRWFCWRFCSPWGRPSSLYRPVGAPRDAAMGARGSLDGGGVVFGAPFNHLSSFIYVYAFVSMGLSILYVYANIYTYIYIYMCVCVHMYDMICVTFGIMRGRLISGSTFDARLSTFFFCETLSC